MTPTEIDRFLASVHPYDTLGPADRATLADEISVVELATGQFAYHLGKPLDGLFLIHDGEIEVTDAHDAVISQLGPRNSFGERGLMRDGTALTTARALQDSQLLLIPASVFAQLLAAEPAVKRFFDRSRPDPAPRKSDLATSRVESFMAQAPVTCPPETTAQEAARLMRDHGISSLCITVGDDLAGIVTVRDLSGKVLGNALPPVTPVQQVMTPSPLTLPPSAIGSDVLHLMMERHIGHVPIVNAGRLVGIVTQTDLTRFHALSSGELVRQVAGAGSAAEMASATAQIPGLLAQLVASGNRHEIVTRLITDIADAATRRLLKLAEQKLGPAPVPYLWLACGSQGRQEQTGVSDQDNCLILSDDVTDAQMPYFAELARFVCDGLNTCGYVYCPGDMMATNPRWCQPRRVWRDYFEGWIAKPDNEAQMLASVMFDLRAIGGDASLFDGLQAEVLERAAKNSIFVAHMVGNSLKHTPPLGLFRGFATIKSGEHKSQIDLKHNGEVPVTDLGRVYALVTKSPVVNTRARLEAAATAGIISKSGAKDLLDAYDLIAETRLTHQAAQVRAGDAPDNYLTPSTLSDLDRSHLRDAFVVVKTMQAALGQGRGLPG